MKFDIGDEVIYYYEKFDKDLTAEKLLIKHGKENLGIVIESSKSEGCEATYKCLYPYIETEQPHAEYGMFVCSMRERNLKLYKKVEPEWEV